jgi:peptidoglycan/xylan/chitin deacetylase (PgdA/CDA1 family)
VHTVDTRDNVVFLTVDDGLVEDPALLRQLGDEDIPVTVFLTTGTVRDWSYWSAFSAVGSIQNHTVDHPQLPPLGTGAAREICGANSDIVTHTGKTPWMVRPPYGAFDDSTLAAAGECGLDYVVHWSVSLPDDILEYQSDGAALKPGDIILTHFRKGLAADIRAAVADIRAQGFEVARLEDYLTPRTPSSSVAPATSADDVVLETETESRAYPLGG